jgi:carbonic anhydrase
MYVLLLAATLTFLAPASEPPHAAEAKHETSPKAKAKEEAAAKLKATEEAAGKAKEEEPAKKPAHRKLPSPVVPAAEEPAVAAPKPVHRVARRPAPAPAHAVPVPVAGSPIAEVIALDARAARLEAENAKLRQQLSSGGNAPQAAIADPAGALRELAAGNQRFVNGARVRTLLSMQDAELRQSLAKGQAPFAVIITCSDSRLADNFIFDQELGRLFTIREAGNSPDTQSLASVEYALEHLHSKLVVVMGHVGCGAVTAVNEAHGKPLPGNLWSLQAAMSGLLESTPEDPNEDAPAHLYHLVVHNAQRQAQAVVDRSDLVRELVAKHQVQVVPAVYDLASGKVTFLSAPAPAAAHAAPAHH